jgi:hypothetical protein
LRNLKGARLERKSGWLEAREEIYTATSLYSKQC